MYAPAATKIFEADDSSVPAGRMRSPAATMAGPVNCCIDVMTSALSPNFVNPPEPEITPSNCPETPGSNW